MAGYGDANKFGGKVYLEQLLQTHKANSCKVSDGKMPLSEDDESMFRILLVEDSEDHIFLIKKELEKVEEKFVIVEAKTGAEADAILTNQCFDIVLLDYNLPEKSGLELLTKIREQSDESQVILTTGMGSERVAADALRLEANDYIIKEGNFAANVIRSVLSAIEKLTLHRRLKEKEKALRLSELKYRTLINQASDGIVIIGSDENITEVNEKVVSMLGVPADQLEGKHWLEIFPVNEKGRLTRLNNSSKPLKSRFETQDGKTIPVDLSMKAVSITEGEFSAIMIIRDVSETERLQEILKEQTERLEALLIQGTN